MNLNYETQRNYEDSLEDLTSQLSDLYQEVRWNENNTENITSIIERKETDEYNESPYISEQDYKKYFAPETFNFKQFGIWSCRFVSSIYWITRMESYKTLIKNSVQKDTYGNFIIKLPLSKEKSSGWKWHTINISAYQNQRTIDGSNPQILHRENEDENQDSWNWIIALAMAIWEELTKRSNTETPNKFDTFDIYRLESWTANEVFSNWRTIKGISLEEMVESDIDNSKLIDINKLKSILWQKDTVVTASVKENKDWSFETMSGDDGSKSNHEITITKIIKELNIEYVQYYDPNFSELRKITVNDFQERCFRYFVFCATDKKDNHYIPVREKAHQDEKNKNSAWIVVENTWKSNDTLRNLRRDFITYEDGGKIIVESRGEKAEIIHERKPEDYWYDIVPINEKWEVIPQRRPYTYRTVSFSSSNCYMYIDTNKLSSKYKWAEDENYKVNLYLPKIANFVNRMIHDYIDTEAWNKENHSPFWINKAWWLILDDNPYNVNLDKIEELERENIEEERRKRKETEKMPLKGDLVCLKHRSELGIGIHDTQTKHEIVRVLNNMVNERLSWW